MIPVSTLGVNFQSLSLGIKLEKTSIEKIKIRYEKRILSHSMLKKGFFSHIIMNDFWHG